jgi:hypothetical protein
MNKIFVFVGWFLLAGMIWALPARAMHEKDSEERIDEMSTRIDELEKSISEKKDLSKWLDVFSFSGLLEVEAGYEKYNPDASGEPTEESSDIVLATMEFGVDAKLNEYVSGRVLFLWEEDDTEPVDLDEGFISISNADEAPFYLTAGRYYVPFGKFETYFISDPFTQELSETNESAVMCGRHGEWIDINAGVFNGDINKTGKDDHVENIFASATYTLPEGSIEKLSLTSGVSYLSSIADSKELSKQFSDFDGDGKTDGLKDYVAGVSGYVTIGFEDRFFFVAEYVSALDDFKPGELAFSDGKLLPSAWNLELAYVSELHIGAGIKYEGTDDCGTFLPESGFGGIVFWYPFEQTYVGLEYMNQEFENCDTNQIATAQLAYEF